MLKKILTAILVAMTLTVALHTSVLARAVNDGDEQTNAANQSPSTEKKDLKKIVKTKSDESNSEFSPKNTLAEYERNKKQGNGFSTTTKVLIGVGIAAAVLTVVIFAAKRDVKSNVFR